jgi:threonine dehydratase
MIEKSSIESAHSRIKDHIRETPILRVSGADFGLDPFPIVLKLEYLQHGGAFKARGAFTNLLSREIPAAGVVAASGGNHGAAVALAAKRVGVRAKIFVPEVCSPAKLARIREYGGDLVVVGEHYGIALAESEKYSEETGALAVHAFDEDYTMRGAGTVALELEKQAPDITTVLAAVGGGGLLAGIASWFAGTNVKVIGVEPEHAPTLTKALEAGEPVDAETGSIANDSLAPRRIGTRVFPIVRQYVDRVLLVTDEEIRRSQEMLWAGARIVVEPGGAAAFGALLAGKYVPSKDERIAVVLSGGNTNAVQFR